MINFIIRYSVILFLIYNLVIVFVNVVIVVFFFGIEEWFGILVIESFRFKDFFFDVLIL